MPKFTMPITEQHNLYAFFDEYPRFEFDYYFTDKDIVCTFEHEFHKKVFTKFLDKTNALIRQHNQGGAA